jgi:hypothetical protein
MIYRHKNTKIKNSSTHEPNLKSSSKFDEKRKNIIEKFLLKFDKIHHKSYEIGKLVKVLNFLFDKPEVVENFNIEKEFSSYEQKVCERLNIKPVSQLSLEKENIPINLSPIKCSSEYLIPKDSNNSFDHNGLKTLLTSNNSHREKS